MQLLEKEKRVYQHKLNNNTQVFINEIKQIDKESIVNSSSKIESYSLWERLKRVFRMK